MRRIFALLLVIIVSLILGVNEGFECGGGPSGQPVVELGVVGISPWGRCPDFVDRTAKWIWTEPAAVSSVPSNRRPVTFIKKYENNQNNVPITINIIVDNWAPAVRLNGAKIGTAKGGYTLQGGGSTKLHGILKPGLNVLEIDAINQGGTKNPAGLVASVFRDSAVLFHTDSSWTWTGNPYSDSTWTWK